MIIPLIVTCLVVLVVLMLNEFWARNQNLHNEFSRKAVHILVGSYVAFWPFYLSWNSIRLLSLAFIVAVGLSKYFHVLKSIHSVTRPTWGEVYFALAVGLVTFITPNKWIYAISLMQMSLADGLAAVIGTRFGKNNEYKLLRDTKSLAGTVTFMVVSYLAILGYPAFIGPLAIGWCLGVAAGATLLENIALYGLDNLLVPLFVAMVLRVLVS